MYFKLFMIQIQTIYKTKKKMCFSMRGLGPELIDSNAFYVHPRNNINKKYAINHKDKEFLRFVSA